LTLICQLSFFRRVGLVSQRHSDSVS